MKTKDVEKLRDEMNAYMKDGSGVPPYPSMGVARTLCRDLLHARSALRTVRRREAQTDRALANANRTIREMSTEIAKVKEELDYAESADREDG